MMKQNETLPKGLVWGNYPPNNSFSFINAFTIKYPLKKGGTPSAVWGFRCFLYFT